jgi:hypothetical protein
MFIYNEADVMVTGNPMIMPRAGGKEQRKVWFFI